LASCDEVSTAIVLTALRVVVAPVDRVRLVKVTRFDLRVLLVVSTAGPES
jgi:hypothetical protein